MEFHEAVTAASVPLAAQLTQPAQNQVTGEVDIIDVSSTLKMQRSYTYFSALNPLVKKWSSLVGDELLKAIDGMTIDESATDSEKEEYASRTQGVFEGTGVDLMVKVFSLGYLLGDPRWDEKPHTSANFADAVKSDRDAHQLLIMRFSQLDWLRERFEETLGMANLHMSLIFRNLDMAGTDEMTHMWARLTQSMGLFNAFQNGISTRRFLEEDAKTEQVTRDLED